MGRGYLLWSVGVVVLKLCFNLFGSIGTAHTANFKAENCRIRGGYAGISDSARRTILGMLPPPSTVPRAARALRFSVVAWIFVMAAIGAFQFFRGEVVDGLVFTIIAGALILDALGLLRRIDTRRWSVSKWFVIVAAVASAAVLIFAPRHGVADFLLLVVIGLLALAYSWPDPSPQRTRVRSAVNGTRFVRSAWLWASVGIAACLWELTVYLLGNFLPGGRTSHPALSDLLDPFVDGPIGRVVFVAAWIIGGIALMRRAAER